jgi:hypothetical protein
LKQGNLNDSLEKMQKDFFKEYYDVMQETAIKGDIRNQ